MVLVIIVLFYVAAAVMYLAINRKSPTASANMWSGNVSLLTPNTGRFVATAQRESLQPKTSQPKIEQSKIPQSNSVKPLLAPIERIFYGALKQAVADNHEVFVKIRVTDLLPVQFTDRDAAVGARKIISEYFDFVVCRRDSLGIVATMRLSNPAADQPSREIEDKLIRAACKNAKIPLIIIKTKPQYDIEQIKRLIDLF